MARLDRSNNRQGHWKIRAALTACLVLAGCGPMVDVVNVNPQDAPALARSVPVYTPVETPVNAMTLKPLQATSCKNKLWDASASQQNAIAQLRVLSRQAGGNAVGNMTCDAPYGTSTRTNCWESIICRGTAITTRQ